MATSGHERKGEQQSEDRGSQSGEMAGATRRRHNYMIDVGFKRKLGSCGGSKGVPVIERIKIASAEEKHPKPKASELLAAEQIDNISVLSTFRFNKIG